MRYRAFFSYARADDKIANWLHRQLDSYRTPKDLVGSQGSRGAVPARLHPIFRDRTDLQAGGQLDQSLLEALNQSEALIVLCTPSSAKSQWVNKECEQFLDMGRAQHIFPVIADGEPDSSDPEKECFPLALRGRGLLAADLREERRGNGALVGDGRHGARLKLLAGLLGVPQDGIARRERARQRVLVASLSAASLLLAGLGLTAGVLGWVAQQNAIAARQNEVRALDTLHQFFVARSHDALGDGHWGIAMRYALAGWRENALRAEGRSADDFRAALASLLYATGGAEITGYTDQCTDGLLGQAGPSRIACIRPGRISIASATGQELASYPVGGEPQNIEYSSNGEHLAFTDGGTIHVRDETDTRASADIEIAGGRVGRIAISHDGAFVVAKTWRDPFLQRGPTRIWASASGRMISQLDGDDGDASVVLFSPTAPLLLVGGMSSVSLREAISGAVLATLTRHNSGPVAAAFSRNGSIVATAGSDGLVHISNASNGGLVQSVQMTRSDDNIGPILALSADGALLATAEQSEGPVIEIWQVERGRRLRTVAAQNGPIVALLFDENDQLLSVGDDGVVHRYHRAIPSITIESSQFWSIAISPDSETYALFSEEGVVNVRSTRDDALRYAVDLGERDDCLEYQPDGRGFVVAAAGRLQFRAAGTGALQREVRAHDEGIADCAFSEDGSLLATGSYGDVVKVWSVADGRLVATLRGHQSTVQAVAFSPDGSRLFSGGGFFLEGDDDYSIRVWRVSDWSLERTFVDHTAMVQDIAVSHDGSLVASAGDDGVRIWRPDTGSLVTRIAEGALCVKFSRDAARLAICSMNRVSIWHVPSGRGVASLSGFNSDTANAFDAEFSRDERTIFTTAGDNTVRRWAIPELVASLDDLLEGSCRLLAERSRRFTVEEIARDPLLLSAWLDRNAPVCATGVETPANARPE